LIGYAVLAFSATTPFPGAAALVPVVGTTFVIHRGKAADSFVRRLLSTPFFVSVGLISYSLYLWHWVVLIFARYWLVRPLQAGEAAVAVVGSCLAAAAS